MSTCPNNRLKFFWRGKKSLFQMHFGMWELINIACVGVLPRNITRERHTSAVSSPAIHHENLTASACSKWFCKRDDDKEITIHPGVSKYYSLLIVLWSLTSAWWLFQRNLPAANLCTCIIASVKLIWLFASNIFSLCLHLGRERPTDCFCVSCPVKCEIYSQLLTRQQWSTLEHL